MNPFFILLLATFLLNIPCGYWRASVKKFSWQWFVAIHLPVPILIALRLIMNENYRLNTFLILIAVYFIGQLLGSTIKKISKKNKQN